MASQQQLLILPCCHCILSGLIVILFTWWSAYFLSLAFHQNCLKHLLFEHLHCQYLYFELNLSWSHQLLQQVYIFHDRCHVDWAVWSRGIGSFNGLSSFDQYRDKIALGRRTYREKIIWKAGVKTVHFHGRKSTVVAKSRVRFKFLPSLAVPCLFVRHPCREARNNKFAKPRNCCLLNVGRVKRHEL